MSVVEVAVAVILDSEKRAVLVSQRAQDVHLAGCWEFPGGKLEARESPLQALQREIAEELGIHVVDATPILTLPYRYPEKDVLLHIFRVDCYDGSPTAQEGQPLRFQPIVSLQPAQFPAANLPIIKWLQLAELYLITPAPDQDWEKYLRRLDVSLRSRDCQLQLRAPHVSDTKYAELAQDLLAHCRQWQRPLIVNCSLAQFENLEADGLHLSAARARQFQSRPIAQDRILACSCHNEAELQQAALIGADAVVLSLVQPSLSHPDASVLGWDGFAELGAQRPFAVYALGGMQIGDIAQAQRYGARGVAGIRALI